MQWEVTGADRATGADSYVVVDADDEAQAIRRANRRGLMAESARPLDAADSEAGMVVAPPAPPPATYRPEPSRVAAQPIYAPPPAPAAPAAPMINQTIIVGGGQSGPSRGTAALLSFIIPGLGQMYKGQVFNGICWFILVAAGYVLFIIPGIILHFFCIVGAAMPGKNKGGGISVVNGPTYH